MRHLQVEFQNCHGIGKLNATFNFRRYSSYAIYAPNGTMKTSFAQTFEDLKNNQDTQDVVFPLRQSVRRIEDESGSPIESSSVVVINSYDETLGLTDDVSTLLVDANLRTEYGKIESILNEKQNELLKSIKDTAHTNLHLDQISEEITNLFSCESFIEACTIIESQLNNSDSSFSDIQFDVIFNAKVKKLFEAEDFQRLLDEYITKLNSLLVDSDFFGQNHFNYYNAEKITESLSANRFFDAQHALLLRNKNSDEEKRVTSSQSFQELIDSEKERISSDKELKKRLNKMGKIINKNIDTRDFYDFISSHVEYMPELADIKQFEKKVWISYFQKNEELLNELMCSVANSNDEKARIEETARQQKTTWENIINLFNARFYVPFKVSIKNRTEMIVGKETIPQLSFDFVDNEQLEPIQRDSLLRVLSNGEKKALYILDILFEVEERKKLGKETLFIIDDIADSFDYKNKYAIIQYLKEMSEESIFHLIILTHNFDFFRTIELRHVVSYGSCLIAYKNDTGIELKQATGIKNPFVADFKLHLYDDATKRIASIPFVRNLIEYTRGTDDKDYMTLTSLLHWKGDTQKINQTDLDNIFNSFFMEEGSFNVSGQPESVVALIFKQANRLLESPESPNLENKLVLTIAVRLEAERYMISKIDDDDFVSNISSDQTGVLYGRFKTLNNGNPENREIVDEAVLMTPESIHVNAFMYEPIIDLSDSHLKESYRRLTELLDEENSHEE
ncbi:hypothetical protein [Bifidobacterium sp. ESL0790]|uniref:hypothetical protein n=1 Tax=Bifidobacterium sp. ESL0790 TaxID=2983233 RepID=UPI0023F784EB|nr:hypothetical protein [Bifidobacterium sp. ESL0790]WEV71721.1 hypothetical protein OZY47_04450 [Bifidobacterium sp. ESL0790]